MMTDTVVTVKLPEAVYRRLKKAADITFRSVDDLMIATLNASLPVLEDLPTDLADELAAMHLLSDDALQAAVQPSLSPSEEYRLKTLNETAANHPLSQAEKAEQDTLIQAYYHSVLRRSQALAILAQRGHAINPDEFLPQPDA